MKLAKEEKSSPKDLKRQRKKKKHTVLLIAEGVVLLIIAAAIFIWNSGVIQNYFPAVTIDGKGYRLAEFNYYYSEYYNRYLEENSQYIPYMFDQSKPLKTQSYSEDQSWFDYFKEETVKSMSGTITMAGEAQKAGFQLSEEDQAAIDQIMKDVGTYAKSKEVSVSEYLKSVYGTGMSEELYKKHLTYNYMAAGYANQLKASYEYTDSQVKAYYEAHREKYTFADYERFYVKACDPDQEPTEEEKAKAKQTADAIWDRVKEGEELETLGREYDSEGTYKAFDSAYYDESFSYAKWLFKEERTEGDSTVIDDGKGYYVMVFHSRSRNDYHTADISDILIEVTKDKLDTSADDYKDQLNQLYEKSCATAEEIQKKWSEDGSTEQEFEELAGKYQTFGAVLNQYQGLTKGTLDDEIDKWCFDEKRSPGDCEVLYTEAGFHVVYYIDAGRPAWEAEVDQDMRDEQYAEWYNNTIDTVQVAGHDLIMKNAGVFGA